MKKTELIIGGIALLSIIGNIFLAPFTGILGILSLSLLSVIYMYFSLSLFLNIPPKQLVNKASYQGISKMRIAGCIAFGFILAMSTIGILFSVQYWPMASELLWNSIIALFIVLLLASFRYFKTKSEFYKKVFKRIAIFGSVALVLALLPDDALFEFKFRNHPAYLEAYKAWQEDPKNETLRERLTEEYDKMHE